MKVSYLWGGGGGEGGQLISWTTLYNSYRQLIFPLKLLKTLEITGQWSFVKNHWKANLFSRTRYLTGKGPCLTETWMSKQSQQNKINNFCLNKCLNKKIFIFLPKYILGLFQSVTGLEQNTFFIKVNHISIQIKQFTTVKLVLLQSSSSCHWSWCWCLVVGRNAFGALGSAVMLLLVNDQCAACWGPYWRKNISSNLQCSSVSSRCVIVPRHTKSIAARCIYLKISRDAVVVTKKMIFTL